ncbi:MAG: hypothetical protein IJ525_00120 [Alphaproteobacteria bacterium]|nr:hypothetical protein [Alphaproteobacteria bacterium]
MINLKIKNNQNGRSMIEMLGVLAIIGVLSVGGIAGYSKAMQKYRINKTIEQITLIAGNIRTFFGRQRDYRGVTDNNILRKAGLIPDEMWEITNEWLSAQNPFGGGVEPSTDKKDDSDVTNTRAFKIMCTQIPQDACVELASQDWTNAGVGLISVRGTKYGIPPLSVDKAVTACSSQNDNYILFYFDVDVNSNYWKNKINL